MLRRSVKPTNEVSKRTLEAGFWIAIRFIFFAVGGSWLMMYPSLDFIERNFGIHLVFFLLHRISLDSACDCWSSYDALCCRRMGTVGIFGRIRVHSPIALALLPESYAEKEWALAIIAAAPVMSHAAVRMCRRRNRLDNSNDRPNHAYFSSSGN
jgi:hypothetical protein